MWDRSLRNTTTASATPTPLQVVFRGKSADTREERGISQIQTRVRKNGRVRSQNVRGTLEDHGMSVALGGSILLRQDASAVAPAVPTELDALRTLFSFWTLRAMPPRAAPSSRIKRSQNGRRTSSLNGLHSQAFEVAECETCETEKSCLPGGL